MEIKVFPTQPHKKADQVQKPSTFIRSHRTFQILVNFSSLTGQIKYVAKQANSENTRCSVAFITVVSDFRYKCSPCIYLLCARSALCFSGTHLHKGQPDLKTNGIIKDKLSSVISEIAAWFTVLITTYSNRRVRRMKSCKINISK